MAKRGARLSRKEQYMRIVEMEGRSWDKCVILAFVFESPSLPERLYYGMRAVDVRHVLFDCWGCNAYVVMPDAEDNSRVIDVALRLGGRQVAPDLK